MTGAIMAALPAHAAGLYPGQAGTKLLISHGGILHRDDFTCFAHARTSITRPATLMAWIDWDTVLSANAPRAAPALRRERRILNLAASIADSLPGSLRDTLPGLDTRNLELLVTAIRHAAGHPPGHR